VMGPWGLPLIGTPDLPGKPPDLPGHYPANVDRQPTRQITTGPTVPVRLPGKPPDLPGHYPANVDRQPTRQMCSVHRGT